MVKLKVSRPTVGVPSPTKKIVSISDSTPDTLYTATVLAGTPGNLKLTSVLVTSLATRASGTVVQVYVGVRYAEDGGGGNWEPLLAPILNPGDSVYATFNLPLFSDGEVVSRADVTNMATVTFTVVPA